MSRNFFSLKTGHHASDEFFKNQAIWHDSDLLKIFLLGAFIGVLSFGFCFCESVIMLENLHTHGSLLPLVVRDTAHMF